MLRVASILGLLMATGCGSGEQARAAMDPPRESEPLPESELVEFNAAVNLCPRFHGSVVSPNELGPAEVAFVAARAQDPDEDDGELVYVWTASSGALSEPDEFGAVEYRCDELGAQIITVVVSDHVGCDAELELGVTCFAD